MENRIVEAAGAYLDYYNHSPASYERVAAVLGKAEYMLDLIVQRSLSELELPQNNVIKLDDYRLRIPDGLPQPE